MKTIWLTKGAVAFVDESDYTDLSRHSWHLQGMGYAARGGGKAPYVLMHRQITGAPKGVNVDHINGDPLDNRQSNLRVCTQSQNQANRRPNRGRRYKGVSTRFAKSCPNNPFVAEASWRERGGFLGFFPTEEEAALAYDRAALEHYGEFARLNFPDERKSA